MADSETLRVENERLRQQNMELRELLAQRVEQVIGATILTGIHAEPGAAVVGLKGGVCGLMANAFAEHLLASGAENYVEAYFTSGEHPELGQIVVTVKRETGKTPHQLRQLAEQKARRRLDLLETVRIGINKHWRPMIGKAVLFRSRLMVHLDTELNRVD